MCKINNVKVGLKVSLMVGSIPSNGFLEALGKL